MDEKKVLSPLRLLIPVGLGIICGILFGDYCSIVKPIGDIYIMMLQSVVYPYLISSLIWGFGQMNAQRAKSFFHNAWYIYLTLIAVLFVILFCLISAIPSTASRIIDATHRETLSAFLQNTLKIFVPENPFAAVVSNFIPAVIVISILYGIALQNFKNKEVQLKFFEVISQASLKIWNWVIKVSPIGIFALIADFSGNIDITKLEEVSIYIILFFLGSLILSFCLLPLMIKAMFPISYREIMTGLQNALLISCITTLSVVALPFIAEMTRKLLKKHEVDTPENEEIIQTSLSVSYPLCQLGNNFILLFLGFALFYFHREISLREKIFLPFLSFLSSIGTPSTVINAAELLSKWVNLPKESLDLYVLLTPITRFAQVLVSVMGMAVFTLLSSLAYFQKLQFQRRFMVYGASVLTFFVFIFYTFHKQFQLLPQPQEPNLMVFEIEEALRKEVKVRVFTSTQEIPSSKATSQSVFQSVRKKGILRVGYNGQMIPWCYFNDKNELVGYDVAFMYKLAKDINVQLEFIPFEWESLLKDISEEKFDLAIGSIYVTAERLEAAKFTQPYDSSKTSLMVRNNRVAEFYTLADILKQKNLKIAVFKDPITLPIALLNFPKEEIVLVHDYRSLPEDIDAALWTKSHTDAWVTVHPGYTSMIPEGLAQGWPLEMAFMLNKKAEDFQQFINYWMTLQSTEGFSQSQYNYWILRIPPQKPTPRWSLLEELRLLKN